MAAVTGPTVKLTLRERMETPARENRRECCREATAGAAAEHGGPAVWHHRRIFQGEGSRGRLREEDKRAWGASAPLLTGHVGCVGRRRGRRYSIGIVHCGGKPRSVDDVSNVVAGFWRVGHPDSKRVSVKYALRNSTFLY